MRRRIMVFMLVIVMFASLPIYVMAYSSRIQVFAPGLNFEGTTAKCTLSVTGDYLTDDIEAVIKLWDGSICLETWTVSASGYLRFNDTHRVTRNREYTLTADVKINNVSYPTVSVSKECE